MLVESDKKSGEKGKITYSKNAALRHFAYIYKEKHYEKIL